MLAAALALGSAWIVLVGGRFGLFYTAPDTTLLTMLLLAAAAVAGWWRLRHPAALTVAVLTVCAAGTACYPRAASEAVLWQGLYLGLFGLALWLTAERAEGWRLLDYLLCLAGAVALVGLLQAAHLLDSDGLYLTETGRPRVLSVLNHPNNLAGYCALWLPAAVGRALSPRRGRGLPVALSVAVALGLLACSALTFSRGGQLALVVGLGAGLLVLVAAGRVRPARRTVVGLGLAAVLVGVAFWHSPLGTRLQLSIHDPGHVARDERLGTWLAAARLVREHPWLGVGPGCFWLAFPAAKPVPSHGEVFNHAHNWYLNVAAEGGLPLLAALWCLFGGVWLGLWRACAAAPEDERPRLAGLAGGFVGFGCAGLFDYNVGVPGVGLSFWLALGIAAGLAPPAAAPTPRRTVREARVGAVAMLWLCGLWVVHNRAQVHYLRALGQWQRGDLRAAGVALERARALDPGQRGYDLARVDLARCAGRTDEARRVLTALDASQPPLDSAYRVTLANLLADEHPDAAADVLARAVRHDPAQAALRVESGLLALRRGRLDEAATHLAQARRLDVDNAAGSVGLAELARRRGQLGAAREALAGAVTFGTKRDNTPRFLAAYGVLDPLNVLPAAQRGRLVPERVRYPSPALGPVRAVLQAAWLDSVTPGR